MALSKFQVYNQFKTADDCKFHILWGIKHCHKSFFGYEVFYLVMRFLWNVYFSCQLSQKRQNFDKLCFLICVLLWSKSLVLMKY